MSRIAASRTASSLPLIESSASLKSDSLRLVMRLASSGKPSIGGGLAVSTAALVAAGVAASGPVTVMFVGDSGVGVMTFVASAGAGAGGPAGGMGAAGVATGPLGGGGGAHGGP